jgi:hypothetical protein
MHVTVYTKNCHSLIVFDTYETFDTCHDAAIVKKGLQKTRFNDSLSVKFCTCQKKTMKKIFMTKILKFFSSYEIHIKCF